MPLEIRICQVKTEIKLILIEYFDTISTEV